VAVSDDRRRHAARFAKRLKALRARSGLTQEALAEKADVSAIYVRQVEAAKRLPSVAVADALRKALTASWEELMG
jgi:transcriptional regulator with XRE-family HTH domain